MAISTLSTSHVSNEKVLKQNVAMQKHASKQNGCANQTYLLGHRGARGEVFENSRKSFEHLKNLALNQFSSNHLIKNKSYDNYLTCLDSINIHHNNLIGVEFDVQLTADGHLVVHHDDNLTRLYHSQSWINQLSLNEVQRLSQSINMQYPIISLLDMPALIKNYQRIELEIKTHQRTNYQQMINALANYLSQENFNNLPITLTSFDLNLLKAIKNHPFLARFARGLLIEPIILPKRTLLNSKPLLINSQFKDINSVYEIPLVAMQLGCCSIGLYHSIFDKKIIDICRRYGLYTTAWTVNKIEDYMRLDSLNVDYIISDYPTQMLSLKSFK